MSYYLHTHKHGQSLIKKREGEASVRIASKWGDGGWLMYPNDHPLRTILEREVRDLSYEEVAMILFQCRERI